MRILLYSHTWAPMVGGVETITMALAKGFAEWPQTHPGESVSVTLVTTTPAGAMDDSLLPFRVVRRPGLWKFIQLVRSSDVLHIAGPAFLPMLLGLIFRKPTVIEHHGYQSVCPNGLLFYWPNQSVCPGHFMAGHYGECVRCNSATVGWTRSFLNTILTFPRRWLARAVPANVVPSRHIGSRISLPRTQVIYHGVLEPSNRGLVSGTQNAVWSPCFAFVGRLISEKGLPVLLRASEQLSQSGSKFRLRIIGDGPLRRYLEELAKELGLTSQIQFVGSVTADSLPELMTDVAAVVMTSICEEVAPLVAIEQMIQGRLIIASDIGGLGEEVDGTGLKFPPGDADALASCMRQVIENPSLPGEIGQKAKRRALEHFTAARMLEEHFGLCQSVAVREPK